MAKQAFYYLETGSVDPAYNLAFEEYVLTHRTEGDYLILWQNENTIVIGQNQNAAAEINVPFVEANGTNVVRRATGGGAVYHDLGNLNYSFISDAGDAETMTYERFIEPVTSALRALGMDAEASGRNDILVNGKKVSGTAQRLVRGRLLYHGTLLFDSDPEKIAGALHVDESKFEGKRSRSVRSRVGSIRGALAQDMTMPVFWAYIKKALTAGDLTETAITEEERAAIQKLAAEKYSTYDWTYGRAKPFHFSARRRFPGGTVEACLDVEQGRIKDAKFYGDFLSLRPLDEPEQALLGAKLSREDLTRALGAFDLREYFGTITLEEVIETILYAGDPE